MTTKILPKFKKFLEETEVLIDGNINEKKFLSEGLALINGFVKEQEERLQDSIHNLEQMNIILDSTPCTISLIGQDLRYITVNQTLANLCSVEKEDFFGKEVGFYTKNRCFLNFSKILLRGKKDTVSQELESTINGEKKKFWVVGSKIDHGSKLLIIGVDITDLKNLEDHITFLDKLSSLGEMVASIIHEVNNPLSLINMKSQNILKKVSTKDNERLKDIGVSEDIETILQTTQKISKIIRGVKSFVRHGNNDEKVKVNLCEIISDAMSICIGKLKMNRVEIEFVEEGEDIPVLCNITQMFQVFVNLITNSSDAITEDVSLKERWITISRNINEECDDFYRIDVCDSGPGVSKEVKEKIFDSFFTTKDLGKGTGLGLSLCKKIIKEHNGDLFVDSTKKNTTFSILLKK